MISFNKISDMKEKYKLYANDWFLKIQNKNMNIGNDIKLKVNHGITMSDAVGNTTLKSGFFNESYELSGNVDGLLHDVGRFPQYYLSGSLKDKESQEFTGFTDHGRYGAYYLGKDNNKLLRYFLGENNEYDEIIKEVVKEHTTITNPDYIKNIDELTNIFQNYHIDEVVKGSKDIKDKLIALKLLVLREEDSLEILHKVSDLLWRPAIGSEKKYHIKDIPWQQFINFDYINMNKLKEQGLWSCNVGFLLRYSLLFHNINFVGTLKNLKEEDTIKKIYINQKNNVTNDNDEYVTDEKLIDPRLYEAYKFTELAIDNLIETSKDGKAITNESREEAKQKTLKAFK